ncbi:MAG: NADH-quinone oxidoreductase subunit J [Anaerolineales bacterium]|nr:NADH-quinone oxidoreductase subunit J [Anaerolineales bacterium]
MTPIQIVFLSVAAVTLFAGVMVVTRRNLIHSAFFLILALFGVAVLFGVMEAGFLAVVQVLVYIGAIAILMIFAIMLTRNVIADKGFNNVAGWAVLVSLAVMAGLVAVLTQIPNVNTTELESLAGRNTVAEMGELLVAVDGYMIPFLVVSLLLTGALVGSIIVAYQGQQKKMGG